MMLLGYQAEALGLALRDLDARARALIVAPTGAGKTVIMGAALGAFHQTPARTLVLQHTITLGRQNRDALRRMNPALRFEYLAEGKSPKRGDYHVLVATVQTASGDCLAHLPAFDFVYVDEAHHIASATYRRVLSALMIRNPALRVLGVTATPERADGAGLAHVFGLEPSYSISVGELVRAGRLVPPRALSLDLVASGIAEKAMAHTWRDGNDREAAAWLNVRVANEEIVRHYIERGNARQAVFFCADIEHAKDLAATFCDLGVDAASVSSLDRRKQTTSILKAFRSGSGPRVLTNAHLLVEGYDAPPVSLIGLARSFGSKSFMIQAIGRGLRLHAGKADCLVLDFVGALRRHENIDAGLDLASKGGTSGERPSNGDNAGDEPGTRETAAHLLTLGLNEAVLARLGAVAKGLDEVALPMTYAHLADDTGPAATKGEARARGLKSYLAANPCRKCGSHERYTRASKCVPCHIEARRKDLSDPLVREQEWAACAARRAAKRAQDPEWAAQERERTRLRKKKPATRARKRARLRERYLSDPEYRAKVQEKRRKHYQERERTDPALRARNIERSRLHNEKKRLDPAWRAQNVERQRVYRAKKRALEGAAPSADI
jgi:superfamily II DNA or RNA helicase